MDVGEEAQRVLRHLRDRVEDSDLPRREIERRLGLHGGYLSQLLSGGIELKYWHLIAVLEAIGYPWARFFAEVFPRRGRRRSPQLAARLRVNRDVVRIYGIGVETVRDLRRRLERCEELLLRLDSGGEWSDPPRPRRRRK